MVLAMRYSGIIENDFAAAPGVNVSFFTQGCPNHCPGCHNPETWDFDGGLEFDEKTLEHLISAISANGVKRNFCIMGGEPLCNENQFLTLYIITEVKRKFPDIKIYLWTGYIYENLVAKNEKRLNDILNKIDVLIDGPFIQEKRDIRLFMRGSTNQRIINLKEEKKEN